MHLNSWKGADRVGDVSVQDASSKLESQYQNIVSWLGPPNRKSDYSDYIESAKTSQNPLTIWNTMKNPRLSVMMEQLVQKKRGWPAMVTTLEVRDMIDDSMEFRTLRFDVSNLEEVAYEGRPSLTSTYMTGALMFSVRRGESIKLDQMFFTFDKSSKGYLDGMLWSQALKTARALDSDLAVKFFAADQGSVDRIFKNGDVVRSLDDRVRYETQHWGCLQRGAFAANALIAEMQEVLRNRPRVPDGEDVAVFPPGSLLMHQTRPENMMYATSGRPGGVHPASELLPKVVQVDTYPTSDYGGRFDPSKRRREIGDAVYAQFDVSAAGRVKYNSSCDDVTMFNEDADMHEVLSKQNTLRPGGYAGLWETKDGAHVPTVLGESLLGGYTIGDLADNFNANKQLRKHLRNGLETVQFSNEVETLKINFRASSGAAPEYVSVLASAIDYASAATRVRLLQDHVKAFVEEGTRSMQRAVALFMDTPGLSEAQKNERVGALISVMKWAYTSFPEEPARDRLAGKVKELIKKAFGFGAGVDSLTPGKIEHGMLKMFLLNVMRSDTSDDDLQASVDTVLNALQTAADEAAFGVVVTAMCATVFKPQELGVFTASVTELKAANVSLGILQRAAPPANPVDMRRAQLRRERAKTSFNIELLMRWPASDFNVIELFFKFDIPVPLALLYVRPSRTYDTHAALLIRKAPDVGVEVSGERHTGLSSNGMGKVSYLTYTMKSACAVLKPECVVVVPDVMVGDALGGAGLDFWDLNDSDQRDLWLDHDIHAGHVVALVLTEPLKTGLHGIDLGRTAFDRVDGMERGKRIGRLPLNTANIYNEHWALPRSSQDEFCPRNSNSTYMMGRNSMVLFAGHYARNNQGEMTRKVMGHSHFGQFEENGSAAARSRMQTVATSDMSVALNM